MQLTPEQREQIDDLMFEGDELALVRYLQNTFHVTAEEALALAEKLKAEHDPEPISASPQHAFERMKNSKQGVNVGKLVGGLFFSIGLLMLTVTAYLIYRDYKFQQRAVPTTGTIVDHKTHYSRNDDGGSTLMYACVYEYDYMGKHYSYTSNTSSSSPSGDIGEQVEVLVDPDNPGDITVNTFWERWTLILILGFIGTIFSTVGYFVRRALGASPS